MPLVQTTVISKHYPSGKTVIRAVSDVSLSIERCEFIAIRGRSGSGKSTLMNVLGLLERLDCGEYALDRLGLAGRSQHWPNQPSGGEQQRVVIARAMGDGPALTLADGPTGAL